MNWNQWLGMPEFAASHGGQIDSLIGWIHVFMLILFVVVGFFAIDAGTPFHSVAGLLQRVLVAVWIACQLVMARRVVRVARAEPVKAVP